MEIRFCCESCGNKYKTDSINSGKRGTCKKCGLPISVPNLNKIENNDQFKDILKTYNNKSSFNDNFVQPISNIFIKDASQLAEGLSPFINEKFNDDNERKWRYHLVFFQSICFSIHMGCRTIHKFDYGVDKRDKFMNAMGDTLYKFTIYHFFKNDITKITKEQKALYYFMLQKTEDSLYECEEYMINPNDDVSYVDKKASGIKSKGLINGLCDILYEILEISNPLTKSMIFLVVSKNYNITYYETNIVSLHKYL
jgi:hypothetical protein